MNPFLQLQKLLSDKKLVLSGVVVQVANDKLQVRTQAGVVYASIADSTYYKVGDDVLIDSGVAKGKLKDQSTIPVYQV